MSSINGPSRISDRQLSGYKTGNWFKESNKYATAQANRAMRPGGPGQKLKQTLLEPYFFSLHHNHLGLSRKYSEPSALYDHHRVGVIIAALEDQFHGCFFHKIETGHGDVYRTGRGRCHVHVIADKNDGPPHLTRDTRAIKPVEDWHRLFRYFYKPGESYSAEAYHDYELTLLIHGRLPQIRNFHFSKERMEWNHNRGSV